ncbi:MAG: sigma-70 family RNA polymerase sigma factor [Oscillospiraceae bacterium]|nr:sigma-70 family RNA polymerase sigma factor [Oscillospiraceae bacterium]MBR3419762.1 sigma-70 family RNA polymerase sigma factor [Oscillospiraceae bacterium]
MNKNRLCEDSIQKHYKSIFQFCLRLLEYDGYAAEECTQEVFFLLVQKKNTLRFDQNIRGWLYSVAERICKDYRKREARRLSYITNTLDDIRDVPSDQIFDDSESLFDKLTDEEYKLLEAYYTTEYGNRTQLAAKKGMSPTQLYKKICAIRKKLKK